MSRSSPTTTARRAASWRARSTQRFAGIDHTATADGALTLDDGLARFDCTIYREIEAGDHTIVLLELHAVEHADTSLPLVFHRSGFGLATA